MLFTPQVKSGRKKKLSRLSEGPFRILQKVSPVNYKIVKRSGKDEQIVHIDRLWLFVPRQPYPEWQVQEDEASSSSDDQSENHDESGEEEEEDFNDGSEKIMVNCYLWDRWLYLLVAQATPVTPMEMIQIQAQVELLQDII